MRWLVSSTFSTVSILINSTRNPLKRTSSYETFCWKSCRQTTLPDDSNEPLGSPFPLHSIRIEEWGFDQFWMPVIAGLCFLPLFIIAVYFLNQLPQPNEGDVADRSKRSVMNSSQRWAFFRTFLPAMMMLLLVYFFSDRLPGFSRQLHAGNTQGNRL
jgi:hypothetical protein